MFQVLHIQLRSLYMLLLASFEFVGCLCVLYSFFVSSLSFFYIIIILHSFLPCFVSMLYVIISVTYLWSNLLIDVSTTRNYVKIALYVFTCIFWVVGCLCVLCSFFFGSSLSFFYTIIILHPFLPCFFYLCYMLLFVSVFCFAYF